MWMELECIMLSEISQSEKDKYHKISLICEIQEIKQMNIGEWKGKKKMKIGREVDPKRLFFF